MSSGLHRLTRELTILVSDGIDALARIPEWMGSCGSVPAPATVFRSPSSSETFVHTLLIPDPLRKRQITIRILPDALDRIQVTIGVADMEKKSPVGGAAVTLFDAKGRYLKKLVSPEAPDGQGQVVFSDMRLGVYQFRVNESGMGWEIPVQLS